LINAWPVSLAKKPRLSSVSNGGNVHNDAAAAWLRLYDAGGRLGCEERAIEIGGVAGLTRVMGAQALVSLIRPLATRAEF
jgi:hypothetical protein